MQTIVSLQKQIVNMFYTICFIQYVLSNMFYNSMQSICIEHTKNVCTLRILCMENAIFYVLNHPCKKEII